MRQDKDYEKIRKDKETERDRLIERERERTSEREGEKENERVRG